ncbi:hypothetical protein [Aurantiacibacter rhizosphaerae]|uniref:Uncharacterized protein n=1 Tax=Aurantiacibacter rhizosphaerae TaxID=2691582 RepID=A0A844XHI3_9SPHN|nr:hypothetical protein [Aurantiacibacter rhizosphaerae]MWV29152.1 hypothetical protein [Aurantiacibacter rhizosphaerae]
MSESLLEKQFTAALMEAYLRAKSEAGYHATVFFRMLNDYGGLETARRLISAPKESEGYTALWELGRLDLTVEAVVWDNAKWHSLFTEEEMARARKRLSDYRYFD